MGNKITVTKEKKFRDFIIIIKDFETHPFTL